MKNFDLKINKLLGGKDLFDKSDYFIVTNIGLIYNEFVNKYGNSKLEKKNIWKSSLLNIKEKNIVITKIPPGNNLLDYLKLVRFYNKKIILCGFCGTLLNDYKIGSIIDDIEFDFTKKGTMLKEVDGLIQDNEFYENILKENYSIVDMESYTLKKFGVTNNIQTKSILVVSDNVFNEPFYTIDIGDIRIIEGIKKLINSFQNNYDNQ